MGVPSGTDPKRLKAHCPGDHLGRADIRQLDPVLGMCRTFGADDDWHPARHLTFRVS